MKKIAIVLSLLTSTLGYAADFSDMATVKRVTPRYIEVNRPISSCQTTTEATPPKEKGIAGAIIGGVAGGLLGSRVGKGNGKVAAGAVGAAVGAGPNEFKRAEEIVKEGVDLIVVDTAHGHTKGVVTVLKEVKAKFRDRLREAHPDHGGDEMKAAVSIDDLGEARRILLANS